MMFWNPIKTTDIRWNFEKYLVDKRGKVRYRFDPDVNPIDLKPFVEHLKEE